MKRQFTTAEVVLEYEAASVKWARLLNNAERRKKCHYSETEDVPPSWDDMIRALEEDR